MGKGTFLTEMLDLITDSKNNYMQGIDVYGDIYYDRKVYSFLYRTRWHDWDNVKIK